jgi:prepilin-type N-terminal cleavage/methylation domain-containing protein
MDITTRNMNVENVNAGQKGFTLIEIIAVLVILGMLAAVAVPKYLSLQQSAAAQTIQAALGAGISQATLDYSQQLLGGDTSAKAITDATADLTANYNIIGDFTFGYAAAANGITVTVTGGSDASGLSVWNNMTAAAQAAATKTVNFQ